jgi:hypothetical protein
MRAPKNLTDKAGREIRMPFISDSASYTGVIYPEQMLIIDRLCRSAAELNLVSADVRNAIERDNLDVLKNLRKRFDAIREEILAGVCELSRHRQDHRCQKL